METVTPCTRNYPSRSPERRRAAHLRQKYGMTPQQYDEILAAQGGGCALCGRLPAQIPLHVDHCHATGVVRGILCAPCNTALGTFGDNADGLRRAIAYLEGR